MLTINRFQGALKGVLRTERGAFTSHNYRWGIPDNVFKRHLVRENVISLWKYTALQNTAQHLLKISLPYREKWKKGTNRVLRPGIGSKFFLALCALFLSASIAQAISIRSLSNLRDVQVFETTGSSTLFNMIPNASVITTRLDDRLSTSNKDLATAPGEFYDFFYSDAN